MKRLLILILVSLNLVACSNNNEDEKEISLNTDISIENTSENLKNEDIINEESKDTNIIDDYGYTFQTLEDNSVEILEPEKEENITEQENTSDEPLLIYTCTKTGLYGIYLKENEQVFLK